MKKGQLLVALALAFALGVVAPVAGVYNSTSVSAFSIEDTTATGKEVANAVAAVEANGTYKQAVSLINAYADYEKGVAGGDIAEFTDTNAKAIVSAMKTAVNDQSAAGGYEIAGVKDNATSSTIAETEAVVAAVRANAQYKAVIALNDAITNGKKDKAALESALKAYYAAYEVATDDQIDFNDNGNVNGVARSFDSIMTAITTSGGAAEISGLNATTGLATFDSVKSAIDAAEENIAKYNAGYSILNPVLSVSGIFNATGKQLYSNAKTLAQMAALIASTSGTPATVTYADGNFVDNLNLTKWSKVQNAIDGAGFTDDSASRGNWTKLEAIAGYYKSATGNTSATTTVMAELAGYQATDPDTPAVNTIKSADGKVSVTGNIPAGVYVEVSEAKIPENFEGFGELKNAAFDIVLKNADGTVYNVDQTLVVSIAVPEGINGANSDVIYITSMGGTENMKAKYADGFMTFTTNHFSIYAIVERAAGDNGGGSNVTPGDTGTVAQAEGTASATGILAGIAAALTAAGAGVVAFRNARRNSKKNA